MKNFPDNDKFYNWYQGTLFDEVRRVGNVFWWIAIAASIGTTYFKNNEMKYQLCLYIGIIALAGGLITEAIKYFKKNKYLSKF